MAIRNNKHIEKDVVIAGAGIAGLATAVALRKVGISEVLVLERSDELRSSGASITLQPNAWIALHALGVSHKLTSRYPPLEKKIVTNVRTGVVQESSLPSPNRIGREKGGIREVHRSKLVESLAQELPKNWILFSSKVTSIENQEEGGACLPIVHLEDGTTIKSKVLIGCDGVHSVVARWLGLAEPVNSGWSVMRGLATFPDEGHGLEKEFRLYEDLGKKAGIFTINDKQVYLFFATYPSPTQEMMIMATRNPELIKKEMIENYGKNFPSLFLNVAWHADVSTLSWAPMVLRYPWHILLGNLRKGNVTVAGDAFHPMTPHIAQGGCCALEDAVVLGRHIGNSFLENGKILVPKKMSKAIDGYVNERRYRGTWVVAASYLSGWVHQDASSWWKKLLRDSILSKYVLPKIWKISYYNCGKLPELSKVELDESTTED